MVVVTNSGFLSALLAGSSGHGWVCAFDGDPGDDRVWKWYGSPYRPGGPMEATVDAYAGQNAYFSVAELRDSDRRGRLKQNFLRLRALVVDDVITRPVDHDPTYAIETSPGKVQVGVFIDPDDPDASSADLVDAVMSELYQRKLLGDNSGNNLVRYVRLPCGINGKPRETGPFQHQVLCWNPGVVYSLADACAVFGIDLEEVRTRAKPAASGDMVLFGDRDQLEVLSGAIRNIVAGTAMHDSLNRAGASLLGTGLQPGAVVNTLRALMSVSAAPRDERFQERYNDIPRSVNDAESKGFKGPSWAPPEPVEKPPLLVHLGSLLKGGLPPVKWLVKGWIEQEALAMLYGPSGVGKSFFAVGFAACIATGTSWHNMAVKQGPVIIVAGEGRVGLAKRFAVWSAATGVSLEEAPIWISERAVHMLDESSASGLVESIDAIVAEKGAMPVAVIVDTVARNFGDGDENSTADMSRFITACDDGIRKRYGATVLLVHHTGHEGGRARGSSALRAALDQELSVSLVAAADVLVLRATKMKDAETPKPMEFKMEEMDIGEDKEGNKISSMVLKKIASEWDEVLVSPRKMEPVTVGWMLERMVGEYLLSRNQLIEKHGLPVSSARTAIDSMVAMGYAVKGGEHATAGFKVTDKARLLIGKAGRAFGRGVDTHNGRAAPDDEVQA